MAKQEQSGLDMPLTARASELDVIASMNIPFFDVGSVNAEDDIRVAIDRVFSSKHYVLGQEVKKFEQSFAAYVGVNECVGVGNGTDALELGLRALNVGPKDRVILVANAAFYGSAATHCVGALPVYVDVDPKTATMDPEKLADALKENPSCACIIVTHLYGQMADMRSIMAIARAHDVPVLEDCAQAHGAMQDGRRAGSFGAVASFSFYPTQNLGALGDGGAVVSDDLRLSDRVRSLRQYGWGQKYAVVHAGGRNSRLDEMQAAVLRQKLPKLEQANARRKEIANAYNKAFAQISLNSFGRYDESSVAHLYVLQCSEREWLASALKKRGVQTAVHYPFPDHLQPAYSCPQSIGTLPVTESLAQSVLSVPCHPGMKDEAVQYVISAVQQCLAQSRGLPS